MCPCHERFEPQFGGPGFNTIPGFINNYKINLTPYESFVPINARKVQCREQFNIAPLASAQPLEAKAPRTGVGAGPQFGGNSYSYGNGYISYWGPGYYPADFTKPPYHRQVIYGPTYVQTEEPESPMPSVLLIAICVILIVLLLCKISKE